MTTRKRRIATALMLTVAALVLGVAVMLAVPRRTECAALGETAQPLVGGDSRSLPRLRLVRTLAAPNEHYPLLHMVSGTSNLTWSPDGERLAAYVRSGVAIMVWSPDGKVQHEIPRYNKAGLTSANILGFLSGHSQLLTGPAASDSANLLAVEDVAFSILDADTGQVIHNVIGLNPGKSFRENIVWQAAISPDQRLVAVVYNVIFDETADRRIGIYSTGNWQRIAAIPFGDEGEVPPANAIAFSPDGKMLAVGYRNKFGDNNRVDIFKVDSWTLIRSIRTFPDAPPRMLLLTGAVRFSRDGSMIAVMLSAGGWREPLRVLRISDGSLIAAAAGFVAGLQEHQIDWSPIGNFIEFLDLNELLYFWDPGSGSRPQEMCQMVRTTNATAFSPDGRLLSQGFADGVNLYALLDNH